MSVSASQIPLYLNSVEVYQLDNFYFKRNELQQALLNLTTAPDFSFVYLWGDAACGKSHLLLAAAQHYKAQALYLPLGNLLNDASPDILQDVARFKLLCIDDLDYIAGRADWEEALFHCFNQLKYSDCKLLIAAKKNPASIALSLPDLRSRMTTALIYQLPQLDDDDKRRALMIQASARGLDLAEDIARYLLKLYSRDMRKLMAIIHTLDRVSIGRRRRLTMPFIRQILTDDKISQQNN